MKMPVFSRAIPRSSLMAEKTSSLKIGSAYKLRVRVGTGEAGYVCVVLWDKTRLKLHLDIWIFLPPFSIKSDHKNFKVRIYHPDSSQIQVSLLCLD